MSVGLVTLFAVACLLVVGPAPARYLFSLATGDAASSRALAEGSEPVPITLLRNGEADGGVADAIQPGETAAELVARAGGVLGFEPGVCCEGGALRTSEGVLVDDVTAVAPGTALHAVPAGRLFVWPSGALGSVNEPAHMPVTPGNTDPIRLRTVSASPRVFTVENFLSSAEADQLVAYAKTRLQRSHVGIGKETFHNERTSKTAWDTSSQGSIAIQQRAFALLGIPWHQPLADAIQIIRYETDQMYVKHTDYFDGGYARSDSSKPDGTNRFVTILCYLSDVEAGGSTVFPMAKTFNLTRRTASQADLAGCAGDDGTCTAQADAEGGAAAGGAADESAASNFSLAGRNQEMPDCGAPGALAMPPRKGDALLFYSQGPDGALDPLSVHGGCPVLQGEKWAANIWLWNKPRPTFDANGAQAGNMGEHQKLHVSFTNERDEDVDLYWVEHGGGHQLFKTIAKHAIYGVNTYVGHRWIVKAHGNAEEVIGTWDMQATTSFVHISKK